MQKVTRNLNQQYRDIEKKRNLIQRRSNKIKNPIRKVREERRN